MSIPCSFVVLSFLDVFDMLGCATCLEMARPSGMDNMDTVIGFICSAWAVGAHLAQPRVQVGFATRVGCSPNARKTPSNIDCVTIKWPYVLDLAKTPVT